MISRATVGALLLLTAGCVTVDNQGGTVPPPLPAEGSCRAEAANDLVGQPATAALGADAMRRTGARSLRWIQPGQAVTMDYRPDRLNIKLDGQNRVEGFNCG